MGGSKKSKSTSTTVKTTAPWIKEPMQRTLGRAEEISSKDWVNYDGKRIADFTPEHQTAFDIAGKTGEHEAGIAKAGEYMEKGGQSFLDADISKYMNPYTDAVLNPVVRELEEGYRRDKNSLAASEVSRGAFGGSRSQVNNEELFKAKQESIGDATSSAHHEAFGVAASLFDADRTAAARTGAQLSDLAALTSRLSAEDFDKALLTGEIKMEREQRGLDIPYMDFVEKRGWDYGGQLAPMIATLGVMPDDGINTTKSKSTPAKASVFSQVAGAVITIGAAYATAGASLAVQAAATAAAATAAAKAQEQSKAQE